MFWRALIVAIFLPAAAFAQPSYFRVFGVDTNDTLNVRAKPDARSADIGDLPPDARGIEVIATDPHGAWAKIIWRESEGWIATRFLKPDLVPRVAGTALPAGLMCVGTEPFWSMRFSQDRATYSDSEGGIYPMALQKVRVAEGRADFPVQTGFAGTDAAGDALVAPTACSDGMSERTYPWRIDLLLTTSGRQRYQVGCCTLPLASGLN